MFKLKYKKHPGRISAKERRALRRFEKKMQAKIMTPNFETVLKQGHMDLAMWGTAKISVDYGELEKALIFRNVALDE